jgi:catechol 2,3-dioxygenase-like lactoylglutathione lyase family enzyme
VPQLDVIGLIVADLGRATAFYQRLGLRFPENPDAEGHGHVETTLPGGLRFTAPLSTAQHDRGASCPDTFRRGRIRLVNGRNLPLRKPAGRIVASDSIAGGSA